MQTKQRDEQQTTQENEEQPRREGVIRSYVLRALGQPTDLYTVQIRRLWDDHYRVNVFVGVDAVSATVAHSYFLVFDSTGKISACTPGIKSEYQPPAEKVTGSLPAV
jgi:hypothetical protein